jgi:hypothetical protein
MNANGFVNRRTAALSLPRPAANILYGSTVRLRESQHLAGCSPSRETAIGQKRP